jgi:hypothetical protein
VVVNSDGAGPLTTNHVSRLTSKAINCSAANKVFVKFQSLLGVYATPSDGNVLLKASTNGTTWTTFNFIPGLDNTNQISANPEISIVDVSSVAANKATVYLQWEWTGNYEYWWMLDDIQIFDADPTPANDLAIGDFFYPASSFSTPASQIATDTFGFYAYVSNNGTQDQNNVTLYAEVRDAANAILFVDSTVVGTIPTGYKDSLIQIAGKFAPELTTGMYSVVYFVKSGAGADGKPADNVKGDFFQVTDLLFAKEDGPTGGTRPGGTPSAWAVANLYRMSATSAENYKAVGIEFAAATDADLPLEHVHVSAHLLRVNDDVVASGFGTFDASQLFSPSLLWVATADYAIPAGSANYDIQSVEISDIVSGNVGSNLDKGASYFAVISYGDDSSHFAYHAFSNTTKHFFISTMVFTDKWYLGGFGQDQNAVVRLAIDLATTTDEKPLPATALTVMPNPVKDVLNLKVTFDTPTDATITIADITGRVIEVDERKALLDDVLKYQVPQLAAGTYIARIATNQGTSTKKFVVQK